MSRGRDKYRKYQAILSILTEVFRFMPKRTRYWFLEKSRFRRGYIGQAIRYSAVKSIALSVGENVSIKEGVFLYHIENMRVGNNVSIWPLTYIDAFGELSIGNDVSIAQGTSILTFEHQFTDHEIPIRDQEVVSLPVVIEDNVWIGAKATILGGTQVKSGSVVGAGAVVTRNVENNSVVAGVPARLVKER